MKNTRSFQCCKVLIGTTLFFSLTSIGSAQFLGTAHSFAVLGASAVTSTGNTVLNGDLGVYGGTSITGFPPGIVNGTTHNANGVAMQAQLDAFAAYEILEDEVPTLDLTGQDLGGMTLTAGVYNFDSSAQLTGILTLDAQGDPNARFDFQMGSTLTTASASSVVIINGGSGCNVYWQVGSSATLGTTTAFEGHILALASVTMNNSASIGMGSAIALTAAVTMDNNLITACPVPEPATMAMLGLGGLALLRRKRK